MRLASWKGTIPKALHELGLMLMTDESVYDRVHPLLVCAILKVFEDDDNSKVKYHADSKEGSKAQGA